MAETVMDVISAVDRASQPTTSSPSGLPVSVQDTEALHFVQAVNQAIDRANRKAISGAQRVQKWTFLPTDFSVHGEELGMCLINAFKSSNLLKCIFFIITGPTMKLKRGFVAKKYADVIEKLYV